MSFHIPSIPAKAYYAFTWPSFQPHGLHSLIPTIEAYKGPETEFGCLLLRIPYDCSDKMNVHQAREGHFNPASPHSSSGAADSFKGTPDTRLTTFSPEDGSARSTRAPGSLNANIREAGPIKYGMNAPQSLDRPSVLYRGSLHLDKDPFVGPADTSFKARQKLSPTASVFSPLPSALRARGSASEPKRVDAFSENLSQHYAQASRLSSPAANASHSNFVHDKLSTEAGISRCLVISTNTGSRLTGTEVELYLSVRVCR